MIPFANVSAKDSVPALAGVSDVAAILVCLCSCRHPYSHWYPRYCSHTYIVRVVAYVSSIADILANLVVADALLMLKILLPLAPL
jgi:hypothetical protein